MHVMAGVMLDERGRVLLAQRPAGKHLAGCWEFPGGKLEPGEPEAHGLIRELREELDVEAEVDEPLIRVPWRYGEKSLLLDARIVRRWCGDAVALEHQALQWCDPKAVDVATLAPADRHILRALQLPPCYPITPTDVLPEHFVIWRQQLHAAIEQGARLLLLRFPIWPAELVRELATDLLPIARAKGAQLVLSADLTGARALGIGVQLKASQLMALHERPLPFAHWVGASCHNEAELAHATHLADFATLSPVCATASHPDVAPLGWSTFQSMVDAASLPVYALGGMHVDDAMTARKAGGQGVAGIRGFW